MNKGKEKLNSKKEEKKRKKEHRKIEANYWENKEKKIDKRKI